jgi:probable HAF family extracellular repeat protein
VEQTIGRAVSADGGVVLVSSGNSTGWMLWTPGTGLVPTGTGIAADLSGDGEVVAGSSGTAFRWTEATGLVDLGTLPNGLASNAYGISADGGTVVGESIGAGSITAFRWTEAGGMQSLGDLPGGTDSSVAVDASADGAVVVGYSYGADGLEAFRWTAAGGMVGLGRISGATDSQALAVSAAGALVLGLSGGQASIWDAANGMRPLADVLASEHGLDLSGWALWTADGISDDRLTVAGTGTGPNAVFEGWVAKLATPLPEPRSAAAGLVVAAALGACARCRSGISFRCREAADRGRTWRSSSVLR